ncbi:MAG: hypothetical protein NVSMB54_19870 [Ktedonobacteraceae bacterium]
MNLPFSGPRKVLGIPLDENSSFLRVPAQASEQIRRALYSDSAHMGTESGLDLLTDTRLQDRRDREVSTSDAAFAQIEMKNQLAARLVQVGIRTRGPPLYRTNNNYLSAWDHYVEQKKHEHRFIIFVTSCD